MPAETVISDNTSHWTDYGVGRLQGKRVIEVRYLTSEEARAMDWYSRCLVILFDDGSYIFPSRDDEGNDAGALFGTSAEGEEWTFPVIQVA